MLLYFLVHHNGPEFFFCACFSLAFGVFVCIHSHILSVGLRSATKYKFSMNEIEHKRKKAMRWHLINGDRNLNSRQSLSFGARFMCSSRKWQCLKLIFMRYKTRVALCFGTSVEILPAQHFMRSFFVCRSCCFCFFSLYVFATLIRNNHYPFSILGLVKETHI